MCIPAAVKAREAGSKNGSGAGAGAPLTARRQHARARTTKPWGRLSDVCSFFLKFNFNGTYTFMKDPNEP